MKLINKNGKVLGLINIIDLAAILFLLALIPMAWQGWGLIYKEKPPPPISTETLEDEQLAWLERWNKAVEAQIRVIKIGEEARERMKK